MRIAGAERVRSSERVGALRDTLLARIEAGLGPVLVHGSRLERVAGNLSLTIPNVRGEEILAALPRIAMSAGSACMTQKGAGSHVLSAMGVPREIARGALRIGLGRFTSKEQIDDERGPRRSSASRGR